MQQEIATPNDLALVPRRSFFARLWKGDVTLSITYWVFYALARAIIGAGVVAFNEELSAKAYFSGHGQEIYVTLDGAVLAYQFFAAIIVWRSANKYAEKKKSGWGGLAKIVAVLGTIATIGQFGNALEGNPTQVESYADQVRQINVALPKMVDSVTRLDAVQYEDGEFIYNYTLTGSFDKSVQEKLRPMVMTNVCENADTRGILKKLNMLYMYRSTSGQPLARILVTDSDCIGP